MVWYILMGGDIVCQKVVQDCAVGKGGWGVVRTVAELSSFTLLETHYIP